MGENSTSIRDLLQSIEIFLKVTLAKESISPFAARERNNLLEKFSVCFPRGIGHTQATLPSTSSASSSYQDMDGNHKEKFENSTEEYVDADVKINTESVESEFYEEFPDSLTTHQTISNSTKNTSDITTIYEEISVCDLRAQAVKFGPLLRKERFIFLDQYRKNWAGLRGHILLLYAGEKDGKPSLILNLEGYKARPAPCYITRDSKKREACFEVVCPGKKTYHFIARTVKDMDQWVNAISQTCGKELISSRYETESILTSKKLRKLPSVPTDSNDGTITYDDITNQHYTEEEIYHDISDSNNDIQKYIAQNTKTYENQGFQEVSSDVESIYDDIGSSFRRDCINIKSDVNELCSQENKNDEDSSITTESRKEAKLDDESDISSEEIYDDIESYFKK